eukprot:scaffold17.g525.t1
MERGLVFGAWVALLSVAAAVRCYQRYGTRGGGEMHNPLERVGRARLALAPDRRTSVCVNASRLAASGAWVEVAWSGVPNPAFDDYIALYASGADVTASAPIKYSWADKSPTHRKTGSGTARFRLLNMRAPLRFAFLRNGLATPLVAAWSQALTFERPNEPTQGHLTLTSGQGEMRVQWVSRDARQPAVQWGTAPDALDSSAAGDSLTYTRADMYHYRYGDEEGGDWSEVASFVAPPGPGPDATVRLFAIADLGQAEEDGSMEASDMLQSRGTVARMAADAAADDRYGLLVHNGDISYARGFGALWDVYFDQLGPLARTVPYMTTIGNHERDWPGSGDRFVQQWDSGGECGVPYYRRTRMPTPAEDKPWYRRASRAGTQAWAGEHAFEPGSEQLAFVEADLKAVDRKRTPWVVLGGHRPLYVDSTFYLWEGSDQKVARQLRAALEPLMWRYRVDATWHGHHHSYQRTCPALRARCVPPAADGSQQAPVHFVIGHAGKRAILNESAGLTPNIHFFRPAIFQTVQLKARHCMGKGHGGHANRGEPGEWSARAPTHYALPSAFAAFGPPRSTATCASPPTPRTCTTRRGGLVVASSDGSIMDELLLTKPPGWGASPAAAPRGLEQVPMPLVPGGGAGGWVRRALGWGWGAAPVHPSAVGGGWLAGA